MLKLLHVDDDADIREVAALSLELDTTIEVRSADSGAAALAVLEGEWRPDVILLDVMMPDLDGPGALEKLRRLPGHAATPVIFMTARAQGRDLRRFIELGAIAVITKPFDPVGLAQLVRGHLAETRG